MNILTKILSEDMNHEDVERYLREHPEDWIEAPGGDEVSTSYFDPKGFPHDIVICRDTSKRDYLYRLADAVRRLAESEGKNDLEMALILSGGRIVRRERGAR